MLIYCVSLSQEKLASIASDQIRIFTILIFTRSQAKFALAEHTQNDDAYHLPASA